MKAIGEKGSRVERLTPGERDKIHQRSPANLASGRRLGNGPSLLFIAS